MEGLSGDLEERLEECNLKKYLAFCLTLSFALTFTGCSGKGIAGQSQIEVSDEVKEALKKTEETNETNSTGSTFVQSENEDILIAYFTWADNTVVEDPDAALSSALAHYESVGDSQAYDNADAIASASLVPPGNTARIAQWIQEETGGDLFSIQTKEPYPSDYDECMDQASDELAQNIRPVLKETIEDISQYDTVFIGYPNWWYSCHMAIHSFIEEHDLSGKKIVLFCTHGTGGIARSAEDIIEALPDDCETEETVLGVYRPEVTSSQNTVLEWLADIGYEKQNTEENENMKQQIAVKAENGESIVFELNDSPAAAALYGQLPLTVDVEDFGTNEKIFYPPDELMLGDTPLAEMNVGTLAYYEPWGNVVMFYDTYSPNGDLYELGRIVSGLDDVSGLSGELRIEKVE